MLYIHIGFNKAGSSTLQRFWTRNAELLARNGLVYAQSGRRNAAHYNLNFQIQGRGAFREAFGGWRELMVEMEEGRGKDFLISSEDFNNLPLKNIRDLRGLLPEIDVRIIAYIRDLTEFVPSNYAQRARSGSTTKNFDAHFNQLAELDQRGIFDRLSRWANVFSWPAMRVRSVDKANLIGGDLVTDALAATGIERSGIDDAIDQTSLSVQNASPGWKTVELLKVLHRIAGVNRNREAENQPNFEAVRYLSLLIRRKGEEIANELGLNSEHAQYLNKAQWRTCRAKYVDQLKLLNGVLDQPIPLPPERDVPDRPFLPSARQVPEGERAAFYARMLLELLPILSSHVTGKRLIQGALRTDEQSDDAG